MLYALRKLIAFVFLGGLFWFIYSDPAEIGRPEFMHALGMMTLIFATFWLVIPEVVVLIRIRHRRQQNAIRYAAWLEKTGGLLSPLQRHANTRLGLAEDEKVYWHEKGTLYVVPQTGFDGVSVPGKPGDVAFPGVRRNRRKIQRTHCYLTNRRIVFLGKAIDYSVKYEGLERFLDKPGGLVFDVVNDGRRYPLAFTFSNPLVAAEYVRLLQHR